MSMYFYKGGWLTNDDDFAEAAYKLNKDFGNVLREYLPNVTAICEENDYYLCENNKYEEQIQEFDNLISSLEYSIDDLDEILDDKVEKIVDEMNEKIKQLKTKLNEIDNKYRGRYGI